MRWKYILMLCIPGFVAVACGVSSNEQQTMEAFDVTYSARLANLYVSATVDIERLVVTQEYLDAQLARADAIQNQMRFTLEARGIDMNDLLDLVTARPEALQGENDNDTRPIVTPGTLQPSRVVVTPISNESPAVIIENSPLSNVVMARSIGNDDCAQEVTSQFTAQDTQIYVVATANNLPAGTSITSSWLRESQELSRFPVTFEFDIQRACIWFFADQTDFDFVPGNYNVELYTTNDLAASASFNITASNP